MQLVIQGVNVDLVHQVDGCNRVKDRICQLLGRQLVIVGFQFHDPRLKRGDPFGQRFEAGRLFLLTRGVVFTGEGSGQAGVGYVQKAGDCGNQNGGKKAAGKWQTH